MSEFPANDAFFAYAETEAFEKSKKAAADFIMKPAPCIPSGIVIYHPGIQGAMADAFLAGWFARQEYQAFTGETK